MTITQCVKKGIQVEVHTYSRYQTIAVNFVNGEGEHDETQFDICALDFEELDALFTDFCTENGYRTNLVTGIRVVASAETMDKLRPSMS